MANIDLIRGDDTDIGVIITDDTAPIAPERINRVDLHAKAQGKIALRLSSTDGSIELGDGELVLHFDRHMTAGRHGNRRRMTYKPSSMTRSRPSCVARLHSLTTSRRWHLIKPKQRLTAHITKPPVITAQVQTADVLTVKVMLPAQTDSRIAYQSIDFTTLLKLTTGIIT